VLFAMTKEASKQHTWQHPEDSETYVLGAKESKRKQSRRGIIPPKRRKKARNTKPCRSTFSTDTHASSIQSNPQDIPIMSLRTGLITLDPPISVVLFDSVPLRLRRSLPASPVLDRLPERRICELEFQASLALRC
jgi:hypothetical protein